MPLIGDLLTHLLNTRGFVTLLHVLNSESRSDSEAVSMLFGLSSRCLKPLAFGAYLAAEAMKLLNWRQSIAVQNGFRLHCS